MHLAHHLPSGLPAAAYQTYAVLNPPSTHTRPATCDEVGCPALANGWITVLDPAADLTAAQAHYIRSESGRRFTESRDDLGRLVFEFAAGQKCFTQHRVSLERDPIYLRRGGDHRGNPLGEQVVHTRAEDWVDDFATHQQQLADLRARG
ncbi:MAG TPA: hypothetical protein VGD67_12120 [Pseudonocardiaceae bacterium]